MLAYETDLWTYLSSTTKPIILYGMGDGADKIIDVCENLGIRISGVFASDGFASGKLFHSFRVTTYAETVNEFGDFIVLVAFATQRAEVLSNIKRISLERELYCPDVPVFGAGLFNSEYLKARLCDADRVYSLLCDDLSKKVFTNVIRGKLTGRISYLEACETDASEAYSELIRPKKNSHYVDIGAYNGDTIREYLSFAKSAATITAFEPDARNFKKLCEYGKAEGLDTSRFYNIAAWDKNESLTFYSRSGRNSAGSTNHSKAKSVEIDADRAERYIENADFINIDAEGSDMKVLVGLEDTISRFRPTISCSVYHRNEDMFDIPQKLYEMYGTCRLYMRHFPYIPAWDTNCYAVPVQN